MQLKTRPEDFLVDEIPIDFSGEGEYLIVHVKKRMLNTEDVAKILSDKLRVLRKNIGYAGTKDKVALTTQYFSFKGLDEERITQFTHKEIELTLVGRHNKPLSLGDLKGNSFVIVARNLKKPLIAKEFVRNYFGPQRFGKQNVAVGRCIIKKSFKEACDLLNLPSKDPCKELLMIPRHTLLLYVHSYQSWLWNTVLEGLVNPPEQLPLIGFGTELEAYGEDVVYRYNRLLEIEEITLRSFIIRQLANISPEGAERDSFVAVQDLVLGEFKDGVQQVSFTLQKGSYATVAVHALL